MTYRWLGNDDKVPQTTTGPRDWMKVWMKMKVGNSCEYLLNLYLSPSNHGRLDRGGVCVGGFIYCYYNN